jgi:hypothetical protein
VFYSTGTTDLLQEFGAQKSEINLKIKNSIETVLSQEECLFPENSYSTRVSKPNFDLTIPDNLTIETYIKIINKIFASIRF